MSLPPEFEPGAKSQRAGGYQFGYWHDGTFCRSTKPLPEGSVMKAFYLCSAAGGKRNNFSKSWFSDVMLHGEYPSALIEEENGNRLRLPLQEALERLRPRCEPSSSGTQQATPGQQRPQAQPQASGSKRGDSSGKHLQTPPLSPSAPAATTQKRLKVEEEDWAEYAVGMDLGSTFTRAAFYKYNDGSSGAIPLEEGDTNSREKETAIYITDGLGAALIGQSAVYRHSLDMKVAMHQQGATKLPILYKNWKRYMAYSWPVAIEGFPQPPPPPGFTIGDDTQLQLDLSTPDGNRLSLHMHVLVMFHVLKTLERIVKVLNEKQGKLRIKKLGIAVPGRYSTPQKETLRHAFHTAAGHLGIDLTFEDICCFGEAAASAVGFLLTSVQNLPESFSFDGLDSGGSSTHVVRLDVANYQGCNSSFELKELSSRTVMCGGYDLNLDMMRFVCERTRTDFDTLQQENPFQYQELYNEVEKAKREFRITVNNQEFGPVLDKARCVNTVASVFFQNQVVQVSVRDLRPNGRPTRSQSPIYNMIMDHNSQFKTKTPRFMLISGGNSNTHLLHLPVHQANVDRRRYSANDACSIAHGAAMLAGGFINFKPLRAKGFGYVFKNNEGKPAFAEITGPFKQPFELKKEEEEVVWQILETIPELPEHRDVTEHSILNAPKRETLLPVLRVTVTHTEKARRKSLTRPGVPRDTNFVINVLFDDQGLPDVEVKPCLQADRDLLHYSIEKLWEGIRFDESLAALKDMKWISL